MHGKYNLIYSKNKKIKTKNFYLPDFFLHDFTDQKLSSNSLFIIRFVPTKEANESNMAVMEISLPSGFTVDRDSLPSLELSSHVKRVETKNGDTMVVLYFDKVEFISQLITR